MARIALSRLVAQMCPTPRGPPHQTQLPDKDATYLERAHNSRFVPSNKTAVFHLGEEQAMPAAAFAPLLSREERDELSYPFVSTGDHIFGRERVRQLLQHLGILTSAECVLCLVKADSCCL